MLRTARESPEHAGGIDGVCKSTMALLASEEQPGEGLEAQIGRVGMGQGENFLRVEIARLTEGGIDVATQEAAFEVGLVGHQHAR